MNSDSPWWDDGSIFCMARVNLTEMLLCDLSVLHWDLCLAARACDLTVFLLLHSPDQVTVAIGALPDDALLIAAGHENAHNEEVYAPETTVVVAASSATYDGNESRSESFSSFRHATTRCIIQGSLLERQATTTALHDNDDVWATWEVLQGLTGSCCFAKPIIVIITYRSEENSTNDRTHCQQSTIIVGSLLSPFPTIATRPATFITIPLFVMTASKELEGKTATDRRTSLHQRLFSITTHSNLVPHPVSAPLLMHNASPICHYDVAMVLFISRSHVVERSRPIKVPTRIFLRPVRLTSPRNKLLQHTSLRTQPSQPQSSPADRIILARSPSTGNLAPPSDDDATGRNMDDNMAGPASAASQPAGGLASHRSQVTHDRAVGTCDAAAWLYYPATTTPFFSSKSSFPPPRNAVQLTLDIEFVTSALCATFVCRCLEPSSSSTNALSALLLYGTPCWICFAVLASVVRFLIPSSCLDDAPSHAKRFSLILNTTFSPRSFPLVIGASSLLLCASCVFHFACSLPSRCRTAALSAPPSEPPPAAAHRRCSRPHPAFYYTRVVRRLAFRRRPNRRKAPRWSKERKEELLQRQIFVVVGHPYVHPAERRRNNRRSRQAAPPPAAQQPQDCAPDRPRKKRTPPSPPPGRLRRHSLLYASCRKSMIGGGRQSRPAAVTVAPAAHATAVAVSNDDVRMADATTVFPAFDDDERMSDASPVVVTDTDDDEHMAEAPSPPPPTIDDDMHDSDGDCILQPTPPKARSPPHRPRQVLGFDDWLVRHVAAPLGLTVHDVIGDGNCYSYALSASALDIPHHAAAFVHKPDSYFSAQYEALFNNSQRIHTDLYNLLPTYASDIGISEDKFPTIIRNNITFDQFAAGGGIPVEDWADSTDCSPLATIAYDYPILILAAARSSSLHGQPDRMCATLFTPLSFLTNHVRDTIHASGYSGRLRTSPLCIRLHDSDNISRVFHALRAAGSPPLTLAFHGAHFRALCHSAGTWRTARLQPTILQAYARETVTTICAAFDPASPQAVWLSSPTEPAPPQRYDQHAPPLAPAAPTWPLLEPFLQAHDTRGDGNCLIYAVLGSLSATHADGSSLDTATGAAPHPLLAAECMHIRLALQRCLKSDTGTRIINSLGLDAADTELLRSSYLMQRSRDGAWPYLEEAHLQALSHILSVPIVVFRCGNQRQFVPTLITSTRHFLPDLPASTADPLGPPALSLPAFVDLLNQTVRSAPNRRIAFIFSNCVHGGPASASDHFTMLSVKPGLASAIDQQRSFPAVHTSLCSAPPPTLEALVTLAKAYRPPLSTPRVDPSQPAPPAAATAATTAAATAPAAARSSPPSQPASSTPLLSGTKRGAPTTTTPPPKRTQPRHTTTPSHTTSFIPRTARPTVEPPAPLPPTIQKQKHSCSARAPPATKSEAEILHERTKKNKTKLHTRTAFFVDSLLYRLRAAPPPTAEHPDSSAFISPAKLLQLDPKQVPEDTAYQVALEALCECTTPTPTAAAGIKALLNTHVRSLPNLRHYGKLVITEWRKWAAEEEAAAAADETAAQIIAATPPHPPATTNSKPTTKRKATTQLTLTATTTKKQHSAAPPPTDQAGPPSADAVVSAAPLSRTPPPAAAAPAATTDDGGPPPPPASYHAS